MTKGTACLLAEAKELLEAAPMQVLEGVDRLFKAQVRSDLSLDQRARIVAAIGQLSTHSNAILAAVQDLGPVLVEADAKVNAEAAKLVAIPEEEPPW